MNAPIQEGHISSAVCHLGNLSYRLGSPAGEEALQQAVRNFKGAKETIERLRQHLLANEVDLRETPMSLGPWLTIDLTTEGITDAAAAHASVTPEEANRLARGSYRAPFVVPESV